MTEPGKSPDQVPESRIAPKKRLRFSFVWIIPIVAAAAGLWIAVTRIMNQGPTITIVFKSAEGLEANKTKIRYNGLDVGTLTTLQLSDDHQRVIAVAEMAPKTEGFLVKDTRVWIVQPRVSGLNITGLGTLISGNYIGIQPGTSQVSERRFTALDKPPPVSAETPGTQFLLKTPELGSIGEGTPLYFRRVQAGQVVSYNLDESGKFLVVKVFVQAPYDKFVVPETRFWQASGVDMSLSASGLKVQTESVMSILAGGIAFETPTAGTVLPPAEANHYFTLYKGRSEAFEPPPVDPHTYLLIFKDSVRGLEPGAPVELHGVKVGEVTKVGAQFDTRTHRFSVPVTVSVDPLKYGVRFVGLSPAQDTKEAHRQAMDAMVSRGLRMQLRTGNLLSGALYVAADFFPDAPRAAVDWSQAPVRLPTVPGQLEEVTETLTRIAKKLDQIDVKEIGDDLRKTINELDKTLVSVQGTLANTDKLVGSADRLMNHADNLIEPTSTFVGGLDGTLQEVGGAARSLRVLADYLERHPEAILRGKPGEAK
jgi:paraquat-inducible protein B